MSHRGQWWLIGWGNEVTPYEELETRFRDLSHLGHAGAILHWDEASMMPAGGGEARGESMALLAAIAHQRLTHPEVGAFLDQAESSNEQLNPWQQANVRAMRRSHQLVEGEILKDFVKRQRRRRLTVFEGLHLLHQMVLGLEMVHNARDYHGDLHSENVMVSRRGIGFDIKFVDLYRWDCPTGENIREDVYDIIKVFHEVVGGSRHYKNHPPVVKKICRGLKRSLIYKKFRSAGALRIYLENMSWDV